jgi:hypothetical protein
MNEWNIQSRARACEACGRGFADQEVYHTLLFDEKRDFRRSDICVACWEKQHSEGAREKKGFVSYWHGVYHVPTPEPETIKKDTAETLLRQLIELNNPRYIPAGYILAVMLERRRLLRVKEQMVRDSKRVFVYEHPKSGDIFTIVDPGLQLNQLEEVQRDVAHLLEHGLTAPEPTPADADAPGNAELASDAPADTPPANVEPAAAS